MNGQVDSRKLVASMLVLVLVAAFAAGCKAQEASSEGRSGAVGGVVPAPSAPSGGEAYDSAQKSAESVTTQNTAAPVAEPDRMIIRTQTLRLEVKSTPEAVKGLRSLAEKHAAVVTDLQVASENDGYVYRYDQYGALVGDGSALRGWVTIRVPAEALSAFVKDAEALGTVKYQAEGSEDVTQQHVDLAARLDNLRAEEQRLRGFFDAAKNVQEMLAIETELNRIRGEIESLDAQVKYLERQAAMATVTVELVEKQPVVRPDGDSWGFKEAITTGFRGAAAVINFVIAFAIATLPLWVVALVVFLIIRTVLKRRRMRLAAVQAEPKLPDA